MEFSVDIGSSILRNNRRLEPADEDMFSIFVNDEEVKLPLFNAISFSAKISKLLIEDSTTRSMTVNIEFRSRESKNKIINILKNCVQNPGSEIENDNEILDFAEFGISSGSQSFIKPLNSYVARLEAEEINENNAIKRIDSKDVLRYIKNHDCCIDQELDFISRNFSSFYNKDFFIEWCKKEKNEERVEQIISNKKLHVIKEDDLFSFVMEISKENKRFMNLFAHVHLERCSTESCRQLLEMIKRDDILLSKDQLNAIIECIGSKLLYEPK